MKKADHSATCRPNPLTEHRAAVKRFDSPILVTQPFLPPMEQLQERLNEIWESRWLTNDGPMHKRFEQRLRDVLNVEHHKIKTIPGKGIIRFNVLSFIVFSLNSRQLYYF